MDRDSHSTVAGSGRSTDEEERRIFGQQGPGEAEGKLTSLRPTAQPRRFRLLQSLQCFLTFWVSSTAPLSWKLVGRPGWDPLPFTICAGIWWPGPQLLVCINAKKTQVQACRSLAPLHVQLMQFDFTARGIYYLHMQGSTFTAQ